MANLIATGTVIQIYVDVGQITVVEDGTNVETALTPTNGIDPNIVPGQSRVQIFDDGSVTLPHSSAIPDT